MSDPAATAAKVPTGLRASGRRLWTSVTAGFQIDEHEQTLLLQAARTVDLLEQLEVAVRRDGALIDSPQGVKAHPAAVEARQQRIALARLMAVLRLPFGDAEDQPAGGRRGQQVGVRGAYGIRGAVS